MDGHFWVEREGKIIDPYFMEYDLIKGIQGLSGDRIYLPAPPLIQCIFEKVLQRSCGKRQYTNYKPRCYECSHNAVYEYQKNGGKIVFGSMGWKRKDGTIHYEFGGENYTAKQFIKDYS